MPHRLPFPIFNPIQLSSIRQPHFVSTREEAAAQRDFHSCASAELSMTKPISVFSVDERGSKLKEPMKTRELSTENAFACRLDPALLRGHRFFGCFSLLF